MSQLSDLQSFVRQSEEVETPQALFHLLQNVGHEMRFNHFALVHHVDLRPVGTMTDHLVTPDFAVLSDYPQYWVDQYISESIVEDDPVLVASQRMATVFSWDSVPSIINLSSEQKKITEMTRKAGLVGGITIPIHIPGELNGSCHFAITEGHELPRQNTYMAQSVGSFAFEAARRLMRRLQRIPRGNPPKLSHRQIECIVFAGKGKTNWEIGTILGISPETVKSHLSNAQAAYGINSRMQLVTRTLFDGIISMNDVVQ